MRDAYYNWMLDKIGGTKRNGRSYVTLLSYLRNLPYAYTMPMDGNRYEDGIDLRYRYAYEAGLSQNDVASEDLFPCSIFEMLLALSLRIEENIMFDPSYGDRTGEWFWEFLDNLGLTRTDDLNFDSEYVSSVLERFVNREYEPNGEGSIVRINDPAKNCLEAELWMQVMWYLSEKA